MNSWTPRRSRRRQAAHEIAPPLAERELQRETGQRADQHAEHELVPLPDGRAAEHVAHRVGRGAADAQHEAGAEPAAPRRARCAALPRPPALRARAGRQRDEQQPGDRRHDAEHGDRADALAERHPRDRRREQRAADLERAGLRRAEARDRLEDEPAAEIGREEAGAHEQQHAGAVPRGHPMADRHVDREQQRGGQHVDRDGDQVAGVERDAAGADLRDDDVRREHRQRSDREQLSHATGMIPAVQGAPE